MTRPTSRRSAQRGHGPTKRHQALQATGPRKKSTRSKPETLVSGARQASNNMVEALGGREQVISVLSESDNPKIMQLVDRLRDSKYVGESFVTSYTSVGLKAVDILAVFQDVAHARAFIHALSEGDAIMQSVIKAAKDQLISHRKCLRGKVIDKKTGFATDMDCVECQGTGYLPRDGERSAQELFFQLLKWKQSGGMVNIGIDNRRQQAVQVVNAGAGQFLPGQPPDVLQIIKRADQVVMTDQALLPAAQSSQDPAQMPEDVIEMEPV